MLTTKKLPVSIGFGTYRTKAHEFLLPSLAGGAGGFEGLMSGTTFPYGAVSYLGKNITVNDVFAKLVDSGRKVENVGQTLAALEAYLRMLQEFKIGNILIVEACAEEPCGFRLRKVADAPPTKSANLP